MTTTATGSRSLVVKSLRTSLAASATFRAWVGASGASANTQALARTHHSVFPSAADREEYTLDELKKLRPCAIVWTESYTAASKNDELNEGVLGVLLFQDVEQDTEDNPTEVSIRLDNVIGGILADMRALTDTAGFLSFDKATSDAWNRSDKDEVPGGGDVLMCELSLEWRGR